MSSDIAISVIGAGSYGTALAVALARIGHNVLLWGRNSLCMQSMKKNRCNYISIPNISFPPSLHIEISLKIALSSCRNILIVVPSHAFTDILIKIKKYLRSDSRVTWATKGLETKTGKLLQDVVKDIFGNHMPLAIISGPVFACELACGLPTTLIISSTNIELKKYLQKLFTYSKNFRIYSNSDCIGIQLSGVVKNVIAISSGISDGIGLGANARTSLITQGLSEMSRLGVALGAKKKTFLGMSGLGDLILTCTDDKSRNRRFGILIGKGASIKSAREQIKQVIEGYSNTNEVNVLAKKHKISMPISEQIYNVLYQNKECKQAILTLLSKNYK